MTKPIPITLPNGKAVGNRFTVYLTPERAQRLANMAEFQAMCHQPYNPASLLDFMLDAADHEITERMSE